MEKQLHLDNIYKNRYQEYLLADGSKKDSRHINWRQVEWERVIGVVTHINGKKYLTRAKNPNCEFLVVYRWAGQEWKNGERKQIRQWSVGWCDGNRAYMTDIDFKTGEIAGRRIEPIEKVADHIHPRVATRVPRRIIL